MKELLTTLYHLTQDSVISMREGQSVRSLVSQRQVSEETAIRCLEQIKDLRIQDRKRKPCCGTVALLGQPATGSGRVVRLQKRR